MLALLAHAAPISCRFPLPIWLYVVAGGTAVLLSAPAAVFAVREAEPAEHLGSICIRRCRRAGRPGPDAVVWILILIALVGGLFSTTEEPTEFFENPVTLLTWVDFWVGLGIVSWLVGNVWERVSPLNIAARVLDRALAAREVQPLAYPAWLGQSPAVALLLVWSWMELIWAPAKEPRTLALLLVGYMIATLVGSAVYGAEAWLGNVELFSVFARTFSRFSPLELRPFVPEEWASTDPRNGRRGCAVRRGAAHGPWAAVRRRRVRVDHTRHRRLRRLVSDRSLRLVPAVVLRSLVVPRPARRRAANVVDVAVVVVFVAAYVSSPAGTRRFSR